MKVKNVKPISGFKKTRFNSWQRLFSGVRSKCLIFFSDVAVVLKKIEQKLISLNILSDKVFQSADSTHFQSSYFSRNQKKVLFANFFVGLLQTIIDLIQLFSQQNEQQLNILTIILNIVLTIMSSLFLFKLSNKIIIFLLVNLIRVILDISLRFRVISSQTGGSFDYSLFFLSQNIVMLLMVNSHMISNSYIKKISWLAVQFIILTLMVVSVRYFSFLVLKAFIYTYIHSVLANLIINFEVGMFQEVYEFKNEALQEKIEIEEILNIISSGILIIDVDLSQVLFANMKLMEMFNGGWEITKFKNWNLKGLLEIFSKEISKITERIFYDNTKEEKNYNKFYTEKKEMSKDRFQDFSEIHENSKEKGYYLNTYAKFQDIFQHLKTNFDYMHKRSMSQNLSAVKSGKHLQLIIKPTVYKQKKAFFLIFNQAFEDEEALQDLNLKEKQKSFGDNRISLSFLLEIIHKLRVPLSMIMSSLKLIMDKKIQETANLMNSLICGLKFQDVCLQNIIELLIFPNENIMIHSKKIEFKSIINEVSEHFSYLAELKDISMTTLIDEKLPIGFRSDECKLKQIFYVLLDNAIKFSPNGGVIKFMVSYKPLLKKAKFIIEDTGIGISIEDLSKLKKVLANPDLKLYLEKGGNANKIGLLLCQNYILMLNKTQPFGLKVKSKENESSTFSFYLDLEDQSLKMSTNDQDNPIKVDIPMVKNLSPEKKPALISRNESGLVIDFNKAVKLQNYQISEEFQRRLMKIKDKTTIATKVIGIENLEMDESNYDANIENTPHMGIKLPSYDITIKSPLPEKINEVSKSSFESDVFPDDRKKPLCEDFLVINENYFHLITLETLLGLNNWRFVKYFDLQSALKMMAAKIQTRSYQDLYRVILIEIGLDLQKNLTNLKILKKGFIKQKIPYIPIIGYCSLENKEISEVLIDKGLSDMMILPITEREFFHKLSPWVVREKT